MKQIVNLFVLLSLVVLVGCSRGDGNVFVTGEVRHKGELLSGATIIFSIEGGSGENAGGVTDDNGRFVLTSATGNFGSGTKPGTYTVAITKRDEIWDGRSYVYSPGSEEPVRNTRAVDILPREYGNPMQTPLRATVTSNTADNVFNFDIP